jgi:hypothetical protein
VANKIEVIDGVEYIEVKFEDQISLQKIREEVGKRYEQYRKTMSLLSADAPIEILCLPKAIENILLSNGLLRVYDLLDCDLTEIKGLGVIRSRQLTSCLDKFIAMS